MQAIERGKFLGNTSQNRAILMNQGDLPYSKDHHSSVCITAPIKLGSSRRMVLPPRLLSSELHCGKIAPTFRPAALAGFAWLNPRFSYYGALQ
jgi:hypothetical protein